MNPTEPNTWTSFAVVKLLVEALVPLVLLVLGILIDRRTKRIVSVATAPRASALDGGLGL